MKKSVTRVDVYHLPAVIHVHVHVKLDAFKL